MILVLKYPGWMHACGTPLPTHTDAIMEHLLVPLVVAVLGASRTIPAPFRVAGVLLSLIGCRAPAQPCRMAIRAARAVLE